MALRLFDLTKKKILAFSALALAIPLGGAIFLSRANAAPHISIPPYPKAPTPNGYNLYVAAAAAMNPANPTVDAGTDIAYVPGSESLAQRYSLERKTAWLNQNKAVFALFDRALQTPTLAPPDRSFFADLRSTRDLSRLAHAKAIESNALWMRGDANGALQSGLDTVQMGHDVRRGSDISLGMNGISISRIGRAKSHDTVDLITASQAASGARRVEKLLQTRWNLVQMLTEEKYALQSRVLNYFETDNWRSNDIFEQESLTLAQRAQIQTISKERILHDIGVKHDFLIAIARLPYAQSSSKLPPAFPDNPFATVFNTDGDRVRFSDARDLAGDQSLMLRLALRAYRLKNGAYPNLLNALVPDTLNAIPADPFGNGESWRYKSSGKTYLLWSIGPDGKDNGGQPIKSTQAPPAPGARAQLSYFEFYSAGDPVAGDYVAGKNG